MLHTALKSRGMPGRLFTNERICIGFLVGLAACAVPLGQFVPAPEESRPRGFHIESSEVRSIQLYGGVEEALPIYQMHNGPPLILEFDLMNWDARPLSAYFYHADRTWRRDLLPSEYLDSYLREDLFDYEVSRGTLNQYVHYRYEFPNESIDFRVSGNFIVRITEQGREDEVLFERPFWVTENMMRARLSLDLHFAGRGNLPVIQPLLRFNPSREIGPAEFNVTVCFVQDRHLLTPRCTERPSLTEQPTLLYYLDPEESFAPQTGRYLVDLRDIRPGRGIERIDLSTTQYSAVLEPDYARFPDLEPDLRLSGQAVISGTDPSMDTWAEYVEVTFEYVPPNEMPLPNDIYVTGAFNGWRMDSGSAMQWVPTTGRYTSTKLLKQGVYEYEYTSPDIQTREILALRFARTDQWYSGLVYYSDRVLNTDRLLTWTQVLSK